MMVDANLLGALRIQSEVCREFGSPFNVTMLAHMAADLEAGGPVAGLLAPWDGVAPFAWLRMEPPPDNLPVVELRLTCWPGGEERLLAEVHLHGAWVKSQN